MLEKFKGEITVSRKIKPIIWTDQAEWKNQTRYKEKILYKDTKARFSVNEQTGLSEAED